uniref:Ribonuclease H-like domain-containing protein n=1 Tax=Tanacetum cinerariifolium TaxID=118510 RepID=A0A6L2KK32_TANCI|nr:ribonuclease H-like domain-containing protein [Tanacetum cinerariifolium]
MAIPEDHLAKFHKMTDAKEMWEAIKSRFGGNDKSKKMQKYLLKQQFKSFLCPIQKDYTKVMTGFKVFRVNLRLMMQVSLLKMPIRSFLGLYLLPGPNGLQLDHKDLEQVDEFDLEEMDLKWQVAMISTRLKKFYKKTGRKLHFDANEPVGFDKSKVECFNCHNTGHFARERRSKGNQDSIDWTGHTEDDTEDHALMAFNSSNSGSDTEKIVLCGRFVKVEGMHAVPPHMTGNYMPPKFDFRIDESKFTYGPKQSTTSESDAKTSDLDSCEPSSSRETLETVPKPVESKSKVINEPKVWSDAPIIKEQTIQDQHTCSQNPKVDQRDWTGLKSNIMGLGYGYTKKACFVCGSFSHLIRDCDFHEKRIAKHVELNKQKASTRTARKVNTARPQVNEIRPRHNVYKSHSPIRMPFNRTTAPKPNFAQHKVNTAKDKSDSAFGGKWETAVKASACCNWRYKRHYWNKVSNYNSGSESRECIDIKDPLGRLKYMIGKKAYLVDYQDFNGGPVAFGGSEGQITGKGKIQTGKLDFEDVYFVKELQHFNLFYVSQMCDKKNKVLFVALNVLYYLLALENIVPSGGLACLIAKATIDESTKWHIRSKGIKREYINARTPQQNGVAERKNRTLIEAARTMLADSFLPNTFWAEVVSTACYVLNRVLVTKPQNKTPYELLTSKIPIISYIRPFGCHVTILNTINHLGKFDEKSDERFLVGYSLSSKAFRVYNLETKRVEENLHINFLENKPNVVGKGPTWLFDLDYLTDSMNYQPITTENKANHTACLKEANNSAGTQNNLDEENSKLEADQAQEYYVLLLWSSYTSTVKSSKAKNGDKKLNEDIDSNTNEESVDQEYQAFLEEFERLKRQEKEGNDADETLRKTFAQNTKDLLLQAVAARASSTNFVNTASTPVNAASTPSNQDDLQIPAFEDIYDHSKDGIFTSASYDDEGAVADFTNLETTVSAAHIWQVRRTFGILGLIVDLFLNDVFFNAGFQLKSNSYTTTKICDTVAAAHYQLMKMGEISKEPSEKRKGLDERKKYVNEQKEHWRHCRNCGDIFCDTCTQGRTTLSAEKHADEVRVCDQCMAEVTPWLS